MSDQSCSTCKYWDSKQNECTYLELPKDYIPQLCIWWKAKEKQYKPDTHHCFKSDKGENE